MMQPNSRILVTGANGFIGKNLLVHLGELLNYSVTKFIRGDSISELPFLVSQVDAVIHLAGENRSNDETSFARINSDLTSSLCDAIKYEHSITGRLVRLVLVSSIHAERDDAYGLSKLAAEVAVRSLAKITGNPCIILRLPGVFGKWCKPNYNSVVATFCHNISRGLPISNLNPKKILRLVYVDDVVRTLLATLELPVSGVLQVQVEPEYSISLEELESQVRKFGKNRESLLVGCVGGGLTRALYATYVSYIPSDNFSYEIPMHSDPRGDFVEMLKTVECGQISYLTARPGVTRGGHYHHTKTEKFLVIHGDALFRFRHLVTNEFIEFRTSASKPTIVDTIPGWTHDITNIGSGEMIVMLWANEIYDRTNPDTFVNDV
jgi:UDP-2-acetamido-2,6-beta-L-arabino-hexul-4-ose reductase